MATALGVGSSFRVLSHANCPRVDSSPRGIRLPLVLLRAGTGPIPLVRPAILGTDDDNNNRILCASGDRRCASQKEGQVGRTSGTVQRSGESCSSCMVSFIFSHTHPALSFAQRRAVATLRRLQFDFAIACAHALQFFEGCSKVVRWQRATSREVNLPPRWDQRAPRRLGSNQEA